MLLAEKCHWNLPCNALFGDNLADSLSHRVGKRWHGCLHSDLHSLKRTQEHIRQKFGAGLVEKSAPYLSNTFHRSSVTHTSSQINHSLVHAREQLLAIAILEDLVEAILACALKAVPDKSR
jgi:hypothetical protein